MPNTPALTEQLKGHFFALFGADVRRSVINSNYELGKYDGKAEGMLEGEALGEEEISKFLGIPIEEI